MVDSFERVRRAQQLLASLPGAYGNGCMRTLIDHARQDGILEQVFAFTAQTPANPGADARLRHQAPRDAAELASALHEVGPSGARAVFEGLTTRTLAYRTAGRYPPAKATAVFRALADLLGPGARWFSNTDLVGWKPVTPSTMDAILVGSGAGVLVAVLATDED